MIPFEQQHAHTLIASLSGNEGYKALLRELDGSLEATLPALSTAENDSQVLRLGRLFQVEYKFLNILKVTPEALAKQIEDELPREDSLYFQGVN